MTKTFEDEAFEWVEHLARVREHCDRLLLERAQQYDDTTNAIIYRAGAAYGFPAVSQTSPTDCPHKDLSLEESVDLCRDLYGGSWQTLIEKLAKRNVKLVREG